MNEKQSKATPGPWRYVRANPSPTTGGHLIAGAKPGYLAEVRDCGSGDVAANAHLIAAAPDMLEALRTAVQLVETDVICARPGDRETLIAALRDWNAAITKATQGA